MSDPEPPRVWWRPGAVHSTVEPLSRIMLFAGEALAIMLVLSGVGVWELDRFGVLTMNWDFGPAVRLLIVTQAVSTLYLFTIGQEGALTIRHRDAVDRRESAERVDPLYRAKLILDTLVNTAVMLLGLLIVAALATPQLRAHAWVTVLASVLPYTIFSVVTFGRGQSPSLYRNLIRSLAYVATPSLVTFFVFLQLVTESMQRYPTSGLLIVFGGALLGASLLTLRARGQSWAKTSRRVTSS